MNLSLAYLLYDNPSKDLSEKDYYSGGMVMPERNFSYENYGFGFNGKLKDDDVKGLGNSYDFGARIYDSRIVQWLSEDPLQKKFPALSPYCHVSNNPIYLVDRDGRDIFINYVDKNGKNDAFHYRPGLALPDNEYVERTVQAIEHLKLQDAPYFDEKGNLISAKSIIDQFTYSTAVDIHINYSPSITETEASGSSGNFGIQWNPSIGLKIEDNAGNLTGESISPSTILIHEFGHIYEAILDYARYNTEKIVSDPHYTELAEKRIITGIENYVASYFGEGKRQNHSGQGYQVIGVTTTQEAISVLGIENKEVVLDQSTSIWK